jgi:hypothetical protein
MAYRNVKSTHAFGGNGIQVRRAGRFKFRQSIAFPWQAAQTVHDQQKDSGIGRFQ